jgi:hypothetical protein
LHNLQASKGKDKPTSLLFKFWFRLFISTYSYNNVSGISGSGSGRVGTSALSRQYHHAREQAVRLLLDKVYTATSGDVTPSTTIITTTAAAAAAATSVGLDFSQAQAFRDLVKVTDRLTRLSAELVPLPG